MASNPPTSETSTTGPAPTQTTQTPAAPISLDSHTLQITQHKLNGTNFQEWSQSVLLVVKRKGKVGYLTGGTSMPDHEAANYEIWDAKNSIVMAWLINSMEPKIGRTYLFYKTTKEVWKAVQALYSDIENMTRCFEIRLAIRTTRQGDHSVTEYYNILT